MSTLFLGTLFKDKEGLSVRLRERLKKVTVFDVLSKNGFQELLHLEIGKLPVVKDFLKIVASIFTRRSYSLYWHSF